MFMFIVGFYVVFVSDFVFQYIFIIYINLCVFLFCPFWLDRVWVWSLFFRFLHTWIVCRQHTCTLHLCTEHEKKNTLAHSQNIHFIQFYFPLEILSNVLNFFYLSTISRRFFLFSELEIFAVFAYYSFLYRFILFNVFAVSHIQLIFVMFCIRHIKCII